MLSAVFVVKDILCFAFLIDYLREIMPCMQQNCNTCTHASPNVRTRYRLCYSMSKNENSMKRRLLYLIPLLVFGFLVVSTTLVRSPTAYAATSTAPVKAPELDCPESPLHWLVCPVIDGMSTAVSALDDFINKQLSVGTPSDSSDPNQIFCNSSSSGSARTSCDAYHAAWASVRNIALGLMVIAVVIVLIAQAVGLEILDAYTIRKVMPRLLVCALAITLSWQLMQFFVTLSNDLAYGIRYIIYQPFSNLPSASLGGGATAISSLFSLSALTLLGWMGLLSYIGTALIAVFIAVLVLILRQLVIIMLIIIAPIAIAAYILPNTAKIYKFWWESFSKALLMFALISGLIATGRVFAAISAVNDNGPIAQMAGFAAYFLPYFLIPATFKFAGGALSQIGGFVNSRGQGAFGALKSYRGNVAKKNIQDLKDGNRLHGEGYGGLMAPYGAFARGFNRFTAGTANLPNAGYNPRRMRQRMSAARSNRLTDQAKEALEKNSDVRALTADDDLVEAANYATDQIRQGSTQGFEDLVRQDLDRRNYHNVEQGTALLRRGRNSMNSDGFDTAMGIAAFGTSSGLTPQRRINPVTGQQEVIGGAAEGRAMINRIAGNDRQRAIQMLGASRQLAESKGRFDLAGGSFTEDAEILDDMHHGTITQANANQRLLRGSLDGTGRGRVFGGHRRNIDAMAPEVRQLLDESFGLGQRPIDGGQAIGPGGAGNPTEVVQQLAFAANALDAASSNSAESARVVNDQILSQEVNLDALHPDVLEALGTITYERNPDGSVMRDTTTGKGVFKEKLGVTTYGHLVEAMRNDENFARYRREYGSASREAALRGQQPPAGGTTPPPGGAAGGAGGAGGP